jgi:hypothetical protein
MRIRQETYRSTRHSGAARLNGERIMCMTRRQPTGSAGSVTAAQHQIDIAVQRARDQIWIGKLAIAHVVHHRHQME